MRQWPLNRFVSGTYKRECDRCGFDYLRSELMKEPDTGYIVCSKCYDPHDPQLDKKSHHERSIKID